jgi:tRNA A-37 threonylcarbamoyl transferase component Bud32
MNKRIAVLVSGDYREFEIAYKSWEFINNPNVDFYFSVWKYTTQCNKKLNIDIKETVNENTIRKFVPNCKGIDIGSPLVSYLHRLNSNKMLNRWLTAIKLMIASGVEYDACIIIRPDLYLTYENDKFYAWLNTLEDNCLYTLDNAATKNRFIQDFMLVGTQRSIEKLLALPNTHDIPHIHSWLAKEFSLIFDRLLEINAVGFAIVRPNVRSRSEVNLDIVKRDVDKWYRTLNAKDNVIHEFKGFSGSKILLIYSLTDFIIRKIDNVERNYEKLKILKDNNFLVPKIINKEDNILDMEYIQGYDMKTFFKLNQLSKFVYFVTSTMNRFKNINVTMKDYTSIYNSQLQWFYGDERLPFTITELIEKLPKILPSTLCHGDFTLDNIIYKEHEFYMIDPSTGVYDSWIFDIAKLRQDLDGKWFLRNRNNKNEFNLELQIIKEELQKELPEAFDDYLYVLMLLRVYKYSHKHTAEQELLLEEIKRVWK